MPGSSDASSEQCNLSSRFDLDQSACGLRSTRSRVVGSRDEARTTWETLLISIKNSDVEQASSHTLHADMTLRTLLRWS